MFASLKEKNLKLGNALETLVKALVGAILGFVSSFFIESCKTFDFSAEKLDIQVQAENKQDDLLNQTFDLSVEKNNGGF